MFEYIIELQNPHWSGVPYTGLFLRSEFEFLLKKLVLKEIQILLGIRRSGKSTLFKLLINHLLEKKIQPEAIVYLNLDDPFFSPVWHSPELLYKVIQTSEKLTGVKPFYLFLDEIQNVTAWEKFVKSVYDNELFKKIFITGSNSSLLKSDFATLISGRYLVDTVRPLSFREILHNEGLKTKRDIQKSKPKVLNLAENLLFYGGFPEVFKTQDTNLKREQLVNYYETIVLKDCINNNKIREIKKFKELALYLLTNNGTLFSYNSLAAAIGSNENTVKEFIRILEDSFLINEVKHYSYSLKDQSKLPKKSFCVDNGLIHSVSFRFSENRGKLFENLIYNELSKMGLEEIYYFTDHKECDFIVKFGKIKIALQVSFDLNSNNYDREITGLMNAMKKLSINKGFIVTFDKEENIKNDIAMIPFWNFFKETIL